LGRERKILAIFGTSGIFGLREQEVLFATAIGLTSVQFTICHRRDRIGFEIEANLWA
jgi:hypothetical protein